MEAGQERATNKKLTMSLLCLYSQASNQMKHMCSHMSARGTEGVGEGEGETNELANNNQRTFHDKT